MSVRDFIDRDPLVDVPVKIANWRSLAACRGTDPQVFFIGPKRDSSVHADYDEARAICATCPVAARCPATQMWAVPGDTDVGCWAGTSPNQRKAIRRHVTALTGARPPRPPVDEG